MEEQRGELIEKLKLLKNRQDNAAKLMNDGQDDLKNIIETKNNVYYTIPSGRSALNNKRDKVFSVEVSDRFKAKKLREKRDEVQSLRDQRHEAENITKKRDKNMPLEDKEHYQCENNGQSANDHFKGSNNAFPQDIQNFEDILNKNNRIEAEPNNNDTHDQYYGQEEDQSLVHREDQGLGYSEDQSLLQDQPKFCDSKALQKCVKLKEDPFTALNARHQEDTSSTIVDDMYRDFALDYTNDEPKYLSDYDIDYGDLIQNLNSSKNRMNQMLSTDKRGDRRYDRTADDKYSKLRNEEYGRRYSTLKHEDYDRNFAESYSKMNNDYSKSDIEAYGRKASYNNMSSKACISSSDAIYNNRSNTERSYSKLKDQAFNHRNQRSYSKPSDESYNILSDDDLKLEYSKPSNDQKSTNILTVSDLKFENYQKKSSCSSSQGISSMSSSSPSVKEQHSPSSGVFTDPEDPPNSDGLDPMVVLSAIENLRPYSKKPPIPPPRGLSRCSSTSSIQFNKPFKPTKIPQMSRSMMSTPEASRPPWRMSSSMFSPSFREGYLDGSHGSCEQLAEVEGLDTPRQMMSNSSTIRCISRIVPMPPAIISPLCTVRMNRARTESPPPMLLDSMISSGYDHMTQSVYAPTEEDRRIVEERWNVKEMDRFKNSFGGRILCPERKLRLFPAKQAKCTDCRHLTIRRRSGRIQKKQVSVRDGCHCEKKAWLMKLWTEKIRPKLPEVKPMDLAFVLGLVSLLAYLIDWLLLA
ncbi:unnamed protein product [Bursaphelenchus okinawaensis]|uniref:Uncharacterized protein n=1 Tax=Bursaphelenchus okinawaensis TaxID=465554 RepID=A0A811KUC3_9BILA|nr:unnamed protein product [Bursaphelenchus okinawaensis]CAG9111114.1 unnamed protein product [Bursaphelenchus okinawaensis]